MKVKKERIKIITLGCSKNLVDSEHIMAQLSRGDIEIVEDEKKASSVIINTCGFIDSAKEESINTILSAVENKKKGKVRNVFVAGCLSERYMDELRKEIPEVNSYFGATSVPKNITAILKEFGADYRENLVGERMITTPGHYSFLKISEGCDNPCSFCAIPLMRGRHVSKPLDEILKEASLLAEKGVKEIIIIGQDTTYWGFDSDKRRKPDTVLRELSKIEGIEWLRLMYAFPSRFPEELIYEIRDNEKVCKYLDIPIQHISDNVLRSMRRGITRKQTVALLEKLRKEIPGLALRTTLMVGYPGETDRDFEELCMFTEEFRFDRLGVFTYSHEESTHAFNLSDKLSVKEKRERQKEILRIQKIISEENNRLSLNKIYRIIIDRKEAGRYTGRTYKDAPEIDQEVYVETAAELNTGDFADVRMYDYEEFDLFGELYKKNS